MTNPLVENLDHLENERQKLIDRNEVIDQDDDLNEAERTIEKQNNTRQIASLDRIIRTIRDDSRPGE